MKTTSAAGVVWPPPTSSARLRERGEARGRFLRSGWAAVILCLNGVFAPGASAEDLPDLKVSKVEIIPNNLLDARTSPVFKPDAILEVAATEAGAAPRETNSPPLVMRMYRSYRLLVTVRNTGRVLPDGPFLVRAECVREGRKPVVLGKTRVCMLGPAVYACFDVFPSELLVAEAEAAGAPLNKVLKKEEASVWAKAKGDCVIRVIVDADDEVSEAHEGAAGKVLEFKAKIQQ